MAEPALRVDIASVFTGAKAFKQAEVATSKLSQNVNTLTKSFVGLYSAQRLVRSGFSAVKAYAADEAAALRLSNAVNNLGMSFANPQITEYINELEKTAAIADDVLRPAFQALLTTTGSLTKSQKLLSDAITISRGKGVELATVAQDLANGYVGITKGLKKYNTGLSQAELKTKSFSEVLNILLTQSSDSANAYLSTTTYKLEALSVASQTAQETIGKGLVDAFAKLGGGSTTQDAINNINNIAKAINAVVNVAATAIGLVSKLYKVFDSISTLGGVFGSEGKLVQYDAKMRAKEAQRLQILKHSARSASPAGTAVKSKQMAAAEAAAAKRAKELAALTKKQTAAIKEQTALQKANGLFELDQIQLVAALKGKLSEEDRKRAELQLAIFQGNTAEASKLAGEVAKAQGLTADLVAYYTSLPDAKNPFGAWLQSLKDAAQLAKDIAAYSPPNISVQSQAAAPSMAATGTNVLQDIYNASVMSGMTAGAIGDTLRYSAMGQAAMGNPIVNVTVQGSVTTQQDLVSAVRDGLLNNSLSGKISTLERSLGTFGG